MLLYIGEKKFVVEYDYLIGKVEKLGIKLGIVVGFGFGFVFFVMFVSYVLVMWYGFVFVINDGLFGGNVISVVFVVFIGGG